MKELTAWDFDKNVCNSDKLDKIYDLLVGKLTVRDYGEGRFLVWEDDAITDEVKALQSKLSKKWYNYANYKNKSLKYIHGGMSESEFLKKKEEYEKKETTKKKKAEERKKKQAIKENSDRGIYGIYCNNKLIYIGKTNVDLSMVDVATMSAHKIHGIKGSGFIYKKDRVTFYPLISGHQSYNSLRAGTSNWPSNVVMSKALEITLANMKEHYVAMKSCQKQIIERLSKIDGIVVNTDINSSIPGIVNFSALNYNPEVLIRALSNKSIYVSSRSVCSVEKKDQVSSTLYAMKKDISICVSSIRTSFVKPLTQEEIDYFITSIEEALNDVRK